MLKEHINEMILPKVENFGFWNIREGVNIIEFLMCIKRYDKLRLYSYLYSYIHSTSV